MATEPNAPQLPTVAEADGWQVTSSSADQPTEAQVIERISDEPAAEPAEETKTIEAPAEERETPAPEPEEKEAVKPRQTAAERKAELQAKINAETRAYHDAKREREAEQAALQQLRQEREALAKAPPPTAVDKPVWSKFEEDGKSYDEFLDARDAFNAAHVISAAKAELQQVRDAERQQFEERQQATRHFEQKAAHEKRIAAAVEKYPDFYDVVEKNLADIPDSPFLTDMVQLREGGEEVLYHMATHPDEARVLVTLEPTKPMRDALMRMPGDPTAVLSYFAQHPQEFDRINREHPAIALVALGEISGRLRGAKNGSPQSESVSHAKPPTRPVAGARTAPVKSPDDMEFSAEWVRAENARDRDRKKLTQGL